MSSILLSYYPTAYGILMLGTYEDELCLCDWRYRAKRSTIDARIQKGLDATYEMGENALLQQTRQQLEEYFDGKRREFDLPLRLVGSEFQIKVWEALQTIPYGEAVSYMQLSKKVEDEKAIRAVSSANGANALSILVPCHRVIGSDGDMVGYAGGVRSKRKLLELEGYLNRQTSLF